MVSLHFQFQALLLGDDAIVSLSLPFLISNRYGCAPCLWGHMNVIFLTLFAGQLSVKKNVQDAHVRFCTHFLNLPDRLFRRLHCRCLQIDIPAKNTACVRC